MAGSRIYILAGDGKQGPLRDVVERQKLEAYIQRYGDFEKLWMPLKDGYPWMFWFDAGLMYLPLRHVQVQA